MKIQTIISAILLFTVSAGLFADPLADPAIPDGEKIRYMVTKNDTVSWTIVETKQESDDSGRYYIIHSESAEQESEIRIRNSGLVPFRTRVRKRHNGLEMTEEIHIGKMPVYGPESIPVIGIQDLIHVLRGFPFAKGGEYDLVFVGREGSAETFSMKIRFEKTEEIAVNGKTWKAHKLRLVPVLSGLMKVGGGLIPKTYLWYSVEKPHYLIRYEGSMGNAGEKHVYEIAGFE
ncbi:MAG: hypothetical protein JW874_12250 [Spirochaetales bacterium]|nr:hypothetical protein [Spirochaetales bacterium]